MGKKVKVPITSETVRFILNLPTEEAMKKAIAMDEIEVDEEWLAQQKKNKEAAAATEEQKNKETEKPENGETKKEEEPKNIQPNKLAEIQKWCKPISDDQARQFISQPEINNLRLFSKETINWDENIFYKVEPGFDFQEQALEIGPCYKNWQNQRQWSLRNKESAFNSLVFWIPRLLPGSCLKNVKKQLELMKEYKKKYNLPEPCLKDFSSASLNTLLILERFHRTNERTPLNNYWIRTNTLRSDGFRLRLGYFDGDGLSCDGWLWGDDGDASLGCFPSGVWNLGS